VTENNSFDLVSSCMTHVQVKLLKSCKVSDRDAPIIGR